MTLLQILGSLHCTRLKSLFTYQTIKHFIQTHDAHVTSHPHLALYYTQYEILNLALNFFTDRDLPKKGTYHSYLQFWLNYMVLYSQPNITMLMCSINQNENITGKCSCKSTLKVSVVSLWKNCEVTSDIFVCFTSFKMFWKLILITPVQNR